MHCATRRRARLKLNPNRPTETCSYVIETELDNMGYGRQVAGRPIRLINIRLIRNKETVNNFKNDCFAAKFNMFFRV